MYLGHMRLHVDRWGLIETVPVDQQPKENVNTDAQKNLSNAEFELVDITTWERAIGVLNFPTHTTIQITVIKMLPDLLSKFSQFQSQLT